MDEIWNIGTLMQIAIIENIRQIAENIYISQYEKLKVESIIERLVDRKPKIERKYNIYKSSKNIKIKMYDTKYPFEHALSFGAGTIIPSSEHVPENAGPTFLSKLVSTIIIFLPHMKSLTNFQQLLYHK